MSPLVKISEEVRTAIDEGRPVVALESTIIAHGLPRPQNLQAAHDFEAILTDAGVVPATIAVIDGVPTVGLDAGELERIALEDIPKVSSRDLAVAVGRKSSGATTVAATSTLAALAGIRVFATGGLGGVHRAAHESFDESADLVTLSRTRVTVVCAGVKSILDIAATLERLETLNVPVVGYRTNQFPAFYLTDSGFALEWRVDSTEEVAAIMAAGDELGTRGALIVANPVPLDHTVPTSGSIGGHELRSIAQSAVFHFAAIEQGGSSLYNSFMTKVTNLDVVAILASIGPVEVYHFAVIQTAIERIRKLEGHDGPDFPDIRQSPNRGDIMPEPCTFLDKSLPVCSVIRPRNTNTAGAAAAATGLVNSGLFLGQSQAFFDAVGPLAEAADAAVRS